MKSVYKDYCLNPIDTQHCPSSDGEGSSSGCWDGWCLFSPLSSFATGTQLEWLLSPQHPTSVQIGRLEQMPSDSIIPFSLSQLAIFLIYNRIQQNYLVSEPGHEQDFHIAPYWGSGNPGPNLLPLGVIWGEPRQDLCTHHPLFINDNLSPLCLWDFFLILKRLL